MKKKTLAILLLIPFVISLLTFASIQILDNAVASDILGIRWDYSENEGFQIDENPYELVATPIIDSTKILANGNNLVFKTKKLKEEDEEYATIQEKEGNFYLYAKKEGQVEIICQNERGSVSKHFIATIFKDGAMIINPKRASSNSNIDKTKYYGMFDFDEKHEKKNASFEVVSTCFTSEGKSSANELVESKNCTFINNIVTPLSQGECSFTLEEPNCHFRATYQFTCIDGVNVYSYDDLLYATNLSENGENVILQTNLESLKNTFVYDEKGNRTEEKISENVSLYGHLNSKKEGDVEQFSFQEEIYTFDTTYDSRFIDTYNEKNSASFSKKVKAGIHLKKSLYGNGYTINFDNLAYPRNGKIDSMSGKLTPDKEKDYFFGPLPFVAIGDIQQMALITALGEDNCGIYIDDDDVLIDDCKLKNCDDVNNLYNLSYTGSIVSVKGKNCTIKNSVLSNGKICLRAYDSDNLTIDNCILKNAGEFNLLFGSDKKNGYDEEKTVKDSFLGEEVNSSFEDFFSNPGGEKSADSILNSFLEDTMNNNLQEKDYSDSLNKIQSYLDNEKGLFNQEGNKNYVATITCKDTLFGRSGVFSIASESYFNGPLLYNALPSTLSSLLSQLGEIAIDKVGGTSYPTKLILLGDTRFYDFKEISSIDVSSLIEENISYVLNSLGMGDKKVTIDEIFPMKEALRKEAKKKNLIYAKEGKEYLNTQIAYYGGGWNLSDVEIQCDQDYNTYSDKFSVDLYDVIKESQTGGLREMMVDAVLMTIGAHPFQFITNGEKEATSPILFDQVPQIQTLKEHLL